MKKVQTPSYWKEKGFQPLAEAKTIYGNRVLIPKKWLHMWNDMLELLDKTVKSLPESQDSLEWKKTYLTPKEKTGYREDLCAVMSESYQE